MINTAGDRLARWLRVIGPIIIVYCIFGLLVEAGVPRIFPDNAFTAIVRDAANFGVFTPIWRILLDVTIAFVLAAFCFSVLYVYIARLQGPAAFSGDLTLGEALYFSIVTMTTTGYGDISPKSGLAKFLVSVQILFGFLYNVLFFSIFASFAGRKRPG